jgi:hypothetical protein
MEHWKMYIFQYIVGGALFIFGLLFAFSSGDMAFQKKECKIYTVALVLGLLGYALLHGVWTYMAIQK